MAERGLTGSAVTAILVLGILACSSGGEQQEMPALMKHRFEAEMKAILHDLKVAQETASALEGQYVEYEALEGRYFNRPVPDTYELTLKDVTPQGFRAEVIHKRSGLRCELLVTESAQSGGGIPRCD